MNGMMGSPWARLSRTNDLVVGEEGGDLRDDGRGGDRGGEGGDEVGDRGSSFLVHSLDISLLKEDRRTFGIILADLTGDASKTPRLRLSRLLVFLMTEPPPGISSTEDEEDM